MKVDIDDALDLTSGTKKNTSSSGGWSMFLILLLSILAGGYYLYTKGYLLDPKTVLGYEQNQQQLSSFETELVALKKELLILSRDKQIQQDTNIQLNQKLTKSEDDLKSAREKLLLYENILSASEQKKGIRVRYFGIKPVNRNDEKTRKYAFTLILSKSMRGIDEVTGQYLLRFSGTESQKKVTYTYRDLHLGDSQPDLRFNLKQYASFEGKIKLPEGFKVSNVDVWVIPKNKKLTTQKKSYIWINLMKQSK
ncbi:MAG: Unknown protein [uncultured Thiotrichaceae bacterium]|uniref:Uncharacterized protein n=1 Tax=uncultured Thiotrichaceae bacterium TaxID=298394 RepID=A0A6S6T3S2_9GAMM|nr:MAG: Unknown protein [uncultured Thiotrichaceae bacterium]